MYFSIEALLTRTLTRLVTAYCSLTLTLRSNAPDGAGLTRYSVCYCYSTIELNDQTRRTPCSLVVALFVMRHASCCLWTMRGHNPGPWRLPGASRSVWSTCAAFLRAESSAAFCVRTLADVQSRRNENENNENNEPSSSRSVIAEVAEH